MEANLTRVRQFSRQSGRSMVGWLRCFVGGIRGRDRGVNGGIQPRKRNGYFAITSSHGTVYVGSFGIALNPTTRRHPRLGLVAGSRGPTQIHIRGLRHWAGEPVDTPGRGFFSRLHRLIWVCLADKPGCGFVSLI